MLTEIIVVLVILAIAMLLDTWRRDRKARRNDADFTGNDYDEPDIQGGGAIAIALIVGTTVGIATGTVLWVFWA